MSNYILFDLDYLEIPIIDFPKAGALIICHDPQKRLGPITWAVLRITGSEPEIPSKALGLFWDQSEAKIFAGGRVGCA